MNFINIFFTYFKDPLEQSLFSTYLSVLSPELREKNSRYVRWQNKHSHLFGKLLLLEAFKKYGFEKNIWDCIVYNSHERPCFLSNEYDFNISHSGNYVICAIGKNIKLGIDIEVNKDIDFKNYQEVMTPNQWNEIKKSNSPVKEFYKYWTIKESIIKADGRGFLIPFDKLEIKNNTVQYDDKLWFVKKIKINEEYATALATNRLSKFKIHEINFYNKRNNQLESVRVNLS
jgi:4'-phosphopantetheinyl transferase